MNQISKNTIIGSVQDFQPKPDFFEHSILIPVITGHIKTISCLFKKMKQMYDLLQNKDTPEAQQYIKNFDQLMTDYYMKKFKNISLPVPTYSSEDQIKAEAKKYREMLLNGIASHLNQYMENIETMGTISNQEDDIKKISEYMINVRKFMLNIKQYKNKIFSIILPLTVMTVINRKTGEEVQRKLYASLEEVVKIGLLPFQTYLDEIASLCEAGITSIDSWFDHLKNKRLQNLEVIVNSSKVQAAQEQTKATKMTFRVQLRFIILSVLFIVASFCLTEYKEEWIDFFQFLLNGERE